MRICVASSDVIYCDGPTAGWLVPFEESVNLPRRASGVQTIHSSGSFRDRLSAIIDLEIAREISTYIAQ